jgi:hypothetical protein
MIDQAFFMRNPMLKLWSKMLSKTAYRKNSRISQSTNGSACHIISYGF